MQSVTWLSLIIFIVFLGIWHFLVSLVYFIETDCNRAFYVLHCMDLYLKGLGSTSIFLGTWRLLALVPPCSSFPVVPHESWTMESVGNFAPFAFLQPLVFPPQYKLTTIWIFPISSLDVVRLLFFSLLPNIVKQAKIDQHNYVFQILKRWATLWYFIIFERETMPAWKSCGGKVQH